MFFQILDEKRKCRAVYHSNQLCDKFDSSKMTHTWSFTPHLQSEKVEYASIWCSGESLDTVCPEELKQEWAEVNKKAKAFLRSFNISKISLEDNCLFDLLPESFLLEFYGIKNEITKSVFKNFTKPKNYDFMADLSGFLERIKNNKLNLKFENLDFTDEKVRNSFGKIKDARPYIQYTPWVTATGRLSTVPNSFPILNLNKELRPAIVPKNDALVELDYNAAELRVLLALLNQDQPKDDIHTWISQNIFNSKYSREDTKKKIFAWLYNPRAKNKKLNDYLDREKILHHFYKNGIVSTPYGRDIEVEEEKAVNYTIQSTTSDLFLTSAIKIDKMLIDKKSKIAFCVHDSLVLDVCNEERHLLQDIIKEFAKTKFGHFKTNLSIGKNYGAMKKIR